MGIDEVTVYLSLLRVDSEHETLKMVRVFELCQRFFFTLSYVIITKRN